MGNESESATGSTAVSGTLSPTGRFDGLGVGLTGVGAGEGLDTGGGAVVSTTVTLKVPLAVLPAASVALQLTTVVPKAKRLPEAGAHDGVIGPSTASLALACPVSWLAFQGYS
jgi:hypothetical protein